VVTERVGITGLTLGSNQCAAQLPKVKLPKVKLPKVQLPKCMKKIIL
jgi:hypothetical protein